MKIKQKQFVSAEMPKPIKLSQVKPAELFRFAQHTFSEAIREDLFYMRSNAPEKDSRIEIFNISTGERLIRDSMHLVHTHVAHLEVEKE